ncbi:hypothetical protein KGF56_003467 [Candida oxycetoniae]|uniref:Uncharacterized protein n=1 Tax=Candida oxycetoniae TaxID=497107 RepID=A0AAI9WX05_9ASCO|nr:uncharacterized protein KGF56_003467 [Candida oxycetoniae]KAI3403742.1 hypothetical protein KGF56_003467 [Candida oxycetoniae]
MSPTSTSNQLLKRLFQSPLLKNPSRWLFGIPRKHSHKFIETQNYDRRALDTNAFAQALTQTYANSRTTVLPLGCGINLTVDKSDDGCILSPIVGRDVGDVPHRLIVNNKQLIEYLKDKPKLTYHFKPLRMETLGLSLQMKSQLAPDITDMIENSYKEKIDSLFKEVSEKLPEIPTGNDGILLTTTTSKSLSQWGDGYMKIDKSIFGLKKDKYIEFANHPELSQLIIAYIDFNS